MSVSISTKERRRELHNCPMERERVMHTAENTACTPSSTLPFKEASHAPNWSELDEKRSLSGMTGLLVAATAEELSSLLESMGRLT